MPNICVSLFQMSSLLFNYGVFLCHGSLDTRDILKIFCFSVGVHPFVSNLFHRAFLGNSSSIELHEAQNPTIYVYKLFPTYKVHQADMFTIYYITAIDV